MSEAPDDFKEAPENTNPLFLKKLVPIKKFAKPARNQTCPCLSGKKFKNCCKTVEELCDRLRELIDENGGEQPETD